MEQSYQITEESSTKKKKNNNNDFFFKKNPTNYTCKNTRDTPKATHRLSKVTNAMVINSKESELLGSELKKNGHDCSTK